MPGSQHELSRNGFVKVITAMVGTAMGAIIGIPAIGYLISPATKAQKSDSWIPLGPLENIPLDEPTLYNFTRSHINGWGKDREQLWCVYLAEKRGRGASFLKCVHTPELPG
jgi:hypothetical protein